MRTLRAKTSIFAARTSKISRTLPLLAALVLGGVGLLPRLASAQPCAFPDLVPQPVNNLPAAAGDVVIADFNRDGNLDAAVSNDANPPSLSSRISTFLGIAGGGFAVTPQNTPFGTMLLSMAAADFNKDGILDVVVVDRTSPTSGQVVRLQGSGNGTFGGGSVVVAAGTQQIDWVSVADLNQDGNPDVIVADTGAGGGTLRVFRGNGTGGFSAGVLLQNGQPLGQPAIADFDRDGKLDIIIPQNLALELRFFKGDGIWITPIVPTPIPTGFAGGPTVAGDFDGDGDADVVVGNQGSGLVHVVHGNGDGTFDTVSIPNFPLINTPGKLVAADLERDGDLDLVATIKTSGGLNVLRNDGSGGFPTTANLVGSTTPTGLAAADLNENGQIDVVDVRPPLQLLRHFNQYGPPCVNPSFGPVAQLFATATEPRGLSRGDFNNDGRLDIVTADGVSDQVSILLASVVTTGTFAAPLNFSAGSGPRYPAVGDFDRDGDLDLAVSLSGGNAISILAGTGTGNFGAPSPIPLPGTPAGVAVGDFDSDGDLDLAVSLSNSQVAVLKGGAGASFDPPGFAPTGVGSVPTWVTAGDYDQDGRLDLAVSDGAQDAVVYLHGRGDLTFDPPSSVPIVPSDQPVMIVSGDWDADGKIDLATVNQLSNDVTALVNLGGGSFNVISGVIAGGSSPISLTVGDWNLDNRPDLVTADGTDASVSVFLGAGTGNFFLFETVASAGEARMAIAGDWTSDGIDDVAVANGTSNGVALIRGKGDGTLRGTVPISVVDPPAAAVAADFDRNGILDVVVATADPSPVSPVDAATLFKGVGDGTFNLGGQITKNTVTKARQVVADDFDRDGKLDVALLFESQEIEVHFGDGAGAFTPGPVVTTGANPTGLVTGDFDRDGDMDLAYANDEAGATSDTVCVRMNNGSGTAFPSPACQNIGVGQEPRHLASGDFNRDGILDLVTANNSGQLSFLRGQPGGTFAAAVSFAFTPAALRAAFVAVADLDLDGNVDLVVADDSANKLRPVRNGTGAGAAVFTFTSPAEIVTPVGPLGIAVGDFNADGKPDIAVAVKGARGVSVYPGSGSFSFSSVFQYGAGSALGGPNQVVTGDWNGDGKTDILATDDSGVAFSVVLNTNCTSRRLEIQNQPSACNPVSPALLSIQPRLTLTDDGDNTNQCEAGSMMAFLVSGPGTLGGTTPIGVLNGNADFTNLSVSAPGVGYRLGFQHNFSSIEARSRRFTAGLTVSITGPPLVCEGQSTVWTASPPTFERYQWKLDSLIVGGDSPSVALGGLTPVLHTLELQATADGCTQMASVPILPTANLSSVTLNLGPGSTMVCTGLTCLGATVSLTEVGGGAITGRQWSYRTTSGVGPEIPLGGETGSVYQIQGSDFPGPGVYYLVEISMPTCGSPLVSSNEVQVTVFGNTAGPRLPVFTATSTHNQNQLEWLNPLGPYEGTLIKYNKSTTGTSDCTVPLDPGEGTLLTLQGTPAMADQRDSKLHDTLEDNTTYCYAAFAAVLPNVYAVPGRPLEARPFDNTVGAVKWAFSTGVSTLSAPGLGAGVVHIVDQEGVVHAVGKGAAGGTWAPLPWKPPVMLLPSQTGRPSAIPVTVAGETPVLFLSSQDGHVYAFSSATGNSVWTPPPSLGTVVQASPSGVFQMFGGSKNLILVGSRNGGANSFYGLDLFNNGSFGALPGWSYSGDITNGQIGMINGQAAVDQTASPPSVYFASHAFGGTNTLWCLNLETGAPLWAVSIGNVSGSVTLRGPTLYIGLDGGNVMAYNASNGSPKWSAPYPTTPNTVKGFVFADRLSDDLYFSAGNLLYSVSDDGAGVNGWTDNWGGGVAFTTSPSTPVVLANDPNQHVYVGGNGRLFRRRQSNGAAFDEFVLGDGVAVTGSPTFDLFDGLAYVGTEAGVVYAVKVLP